MKKSNVLERLRELREYEVQTQLDVNKKQGETRKGREKRLKESSTKRKVESQK